MPIHQVSPRHRATRASRTVGIIRGVFLSVFINPYALVVAVVTFGILVHGIRGLVTGTAHVDWTFTSVIGCGACLAMLVLVALMATTHFVVTVLLGTHRSNVSAKMTQSSV